MVSVCGVVGMDGWVGVGVGVDAGLWDHKCDCMGCTLCIYIYIYICGYRSKDVEYKCMFSCVVVQGWVGYQ